MPETIIGALIGVGGTVLGTIVGAIISYYYSFNLVKKTEFIKACVEFKLAFSWIVQWLNDEAIKSSERVFGKLRQRDISERHENAIRKFRIYLCAAKQLEFDKVCINFYNEKNNHRYEGYVLLNSPSPKEEESNLALDNVNKLFHFADY